MMVFNYKKQVIDQKNRSRFRKNEIFYACCSILEQSQFSNQLFYYYFKRQNQAFFISNIRNKCIISGYQKTVFLKFKLGRHALSNKILSGYMSGFYRAVW